MAMPGIAWKHLITCTSCSKENYFIETRMGELPDLTIYNLVILQEPWLFDGPY